LGNEENANGTFRARLNCRTGPRHPLARPKINCNFGCDFNDHYSYCFCLYDYGWLDWTNIGRTRSFLWREFVSEGPTGYGTILWHQHVPTIAQDTLWTETVSFPLLDIFIHLQCSRSKADPCLYFRWTDTPLLWFSWVDDCFITGPTEELLELKGNITKEVDCDDSGKIKEFVPTQLITKLIREPGRVVAARGMHCRNKQR
jgi:hypothetical protein